MPWALTAAALAEVPPPPSLRGDVIVGVGIPAGRPLELHIRMVRALRALVARGFRQLVLPASYADLLPEVQRGLPPVLTAARFDPFLVDMPTVVVCVDGPIASSVFSSGPPTPRVVFFPEGAPDPDVPYRALRHRTDARRLDHLLAELTA